ncbi:hypothetical protein [Amycolatopsis sp. CA-128772]|uniref:hypothetical protein n=1 Tax=Amycolatopsis sp. CA-128772 TaxID=2073159 RepID=UPI000CD2A7EC|nr:hypothetical protein [Amycolatopsis sp. CA-128772]
MKIRLGCLLLVALTAACAPSTGYGTIVADPTHAVPTPTTTAPPAPREVPTETHTGKGSGEFQTSWPPDQLGFFTFDCPKCRDNVIIDTDGGEHGLVNAIGAYKGTTWMNTEPDRPTKRVTVHADAAWTATIADYRSISLAESGKPASGKGDSVVKIPAGVTRIQFTAKTRSNIAIWWMSEDDRDLILNQIGDVQVERDVKGPAYLMVEGYEATWTLTPS